MITYIVQSKKKPGTQLMRYYAQIAPGNPIRVADVADRISRECTVSMPDIKAVLSALEHTVIEAMKMGLSVRLGDLGSFRPTLTSSPADTPEDCSAANILRCRCRFSPSGLMRRSLDLRNIEFGKREFKAAGDETV